ncbi:hypothetical protein O6H91_06G034300 [Diphasiastrum complanatum]|uniref:Uncharacterized protein n=1 Tax=Diphasiastrum complanatum TaxID=34168 RepID=A0ACC2DCB0_DIPCM|nr:hypothetical protein O6H91_06G034300 [Diphasiastrum complanatum]
MDSRFEVWKTEVTALLILCLLMAEDSGFSDFTVVAAFDSRNLKLQSCPCEELYLVKGDDTLHSVSSKCSAPFILIDNPQIQDDDDIAEGLVLKIQCFPQ